jgi:Transglycosylase SLT domain
MAIPPFVPGTLSFNGAKASPEVASAIHKASASTGVDFAYLVAQAGQESSFRPDAKAGTSSATGLYQFVESTWLNMVRDKGAQYGLGDLASQIDATDGGPRVADPTVRRKILDLRNDPTVAAAMAAEYAKSNRTQLADALGRSVNSTDLYMAHFLGPAGAAKFLSTLGASPGTAGASVLPEAAAANRGVFYDSQGNPRTVAQIYKHYADRFGDATQQIASAMPSNSTASGTAPVSPFSPAALAKAAIFQALAGDQLSPVAIDALLKLDVPRALNRADKSSSTT